MSVKFPVKLCNFRPSLSVIFAQLTGKSEFFGYVHSSGRLFLVKFRDDGVGGVGDDGAEDTGDVTGSESDDELFACRTIKYTNQYYGNVKMDWHPSAPNVRRQIFCPRYLNLCEAPSQRTHFYSYLQVFDYINMFI